MRRPTAAGITLAVAATILRACELNAPDERDVDHIEIVNRMDVDIDARWRGGTLPTETIPAQDGDALPSIIVQPPSGECFDDVMELVDTDTDQVLELEQLCNWGGTINLRDDGTAVRGSDEIGQFEEVG